MMVDKFIFTFIFGLNIVLCGQISTESIDSAIVFASSNMRNTIVEINNDSTLHPNQTDISTGVWEYSSRTGWTSGFFSGAAWYMYELTNYDPFWLSISTRWTEDLETQKNDTGSHDVGFQILCSYGNAYRITQNEDYKNIILTAAQSLATRYDENIGAIRSWSWGSWNYPVIIDNMMNLELLMWASENGGEEHLKEIAINHARKTMQNHVRNDGSTYHIVDYNNDGSVKEKDTHQGYSVESTWSRGQAWGLYGFTMMYRFTKNDTFLTVAKNLSDYFIDNSPYDFVPFSDFEDPNIPNISKDASAAAIACSALLELSEYVDDEKYKNAAIDILSSLINNYLSKNSNYHSIVKRGCVRSGEPERGLIYADYYFLEALLRYKTTITNIDGDENLINSNFQLFQNYPNPFNPTTIIQYSVPFGEQLDKSFYNVQLKVYDVIGKEVTTLIDKNQNPGLYQFTFDASNRPSGVYFYKLKVGSFSQTNKMVLLR